MRYRVNIAIRIATLAAVWLLVDAGAALAASVTPLPDYSNGTVRLAATFTEPCDQVQLLVGGELRETITVSPGEASVETTSIALGAKADFVLRGVSGTQPTWTEALTLDPANYRPLRPTLALVNRKVVGSVVNVAASDARPVTKVRARGDESRPWALLTLPGPATSFTVRSLRPVRGPSLLQVIAYNGFGASPVASRIVYWIGSVPSTTRSVVADKQFVGIFHIYRGRVVRWWPCAFGKYGTPTPNGDFKIGAARPASGAWGVLRRRLYRARTGAPTMYYIHGTNAPWSIGTFASHGCIRMYNSHVKEFARTVPNGTRVRIH